MSIETKGAGAGRLVERELLRRLEAAGANGLLADRLLEGAEGPAEVITAALAELQRRGLAVEHDGRWRALRHSGWSVGVVERIEGGDGVVRLRGERDPGFFVPRRRLRGALDGDTVLVEEVVSQRRGRRGDLAEAVVLRVLDHGHPRLVGTLELDEVGRRWLVPFDPRVSLEVEVLEAEDLLEDHWVVVAIERGGAPTRHPRGRVVEVLGGLDTSGVDVAVVLRHYGIPDELSAAALRAAAQLPADPAAADWRGREDLRDQVIVTIDGASARDFDDAVSIEPLGHGGVRLGVHIADVAHYVRPGSVLDLEAFRRGTSVYYPDRAVPMLPERLSAGLCSLRPGVPRLTLSVFLDFDREGRVTGRRFAESVIQSHRRLTYQEVRRLIEEPAPGDAAEYGAVLPRLAAMRALMERLYAARRARGSIDFDLPTGDVVLDTDGTIVGIQPGERLVSHRIIEELMIAANEAVAEELARRELPALYRVHDPPPREAAENLRAVLATFGVKLRGDLSRLAPADLQAVIEEVAGRPEERFVESLVLHSLSRAVYSPHCRGHYALAAPFYTHFTSPIRRYPDLLVHRTLKAVVAGGDPAAALAAADPGLGDRLEAIAEHASATERRAEQSERDLLQWKKVRFLAGRVGERFAGRITGVQPFGFFVQLEDLHVDGLVPIRTLEDDYYLYEPEAHRLIGDRHGRRFRLGDQLEVVLTGVSERHRGLDLKPAELGEPSARKRKQSSARKRGEPSPRRRGEPPAKRRGQNKGGRRRR